MSRNPEPLIDEAWTDMVHGHPPLRVTRGVLRSKGLLGGRSSKAVLLYNVLGGRGTVEGWTGPATLPSALQANPTSSLVPFDPIVVTNWEVLDAFHPSLFLGKITDV